MPATGYTTVSVSVETLNRLRRYKDGSKSLDDILNDFMDDYPSQEFLVEMARRAAGPGRPYQEIRKELLAGR